VVRAKSSYQQQQSRLPSLDVTAAAPAQVRSQGARSPLRVAWKTIKVLVTFVMLAATALVIGFVAAVVKVQRDAEKPAPITRAEYRHVKGGMTAHRVRQMLGKPTVVNTPTEGTTGQPHARQRCWYYGTLDSKGPAYAVCYARGKVIDKWRQK
jgi:hypothetical protein